MDDSNLTVDEQVEQTDRLRMMVLGRLEKVGMVEDKTTVSRMFETMKSIMRSGRPSSHRERQSARIDINRVMAHVRTPAQDAVTKELKEFLKRRQLKEAAEEAAKRAARGTPASTRKRTSPPPRERKN